MEFWTMTSRGWGKSPRDTLACYMLSFTRLAALNPHPSILKPKSSILYPESSILNLEPSILNPEH